MLKVKYCCLDLDGVLVDFVGGMCRAHGRDNPFHCDDYNGVYEMESIWGMPSSEFWKPSSDPSFWEDLDWTDDGPRLYAIVRQYFHIDQIIILSSSMSAAGAAGKITWIKRHIPEMRDRFLIGPRKEFCANSATALVDDSDGKIATFSVYGGHGVLVPRPWNLAHHIDQATVPSIVSLQLANLTGRTVIPEGESERRYVL